MKNNNTLYIFLFILLSGCYSDEHEKTIIQNKSVVADSSSDSYSPSAPDSSPLPDSPSLTSLYNGTPTIGIIPKPSSMSQNSGGWVIDERVTITYDAGLEFEASYLADKFKTYANITLNTVEQTGVTSEQNNTIELKINTPTAFSDEGYALTISHGKAQIKASDTAGIFYGIQSLIQLMPLSEEKVLPFIQIMDTPRFKWRGLMVDSSRHFYTVDNIKKILDTMAFHKINKFHWHLTDDQGWRIQITDYPALTNTGACRTSTPPYGARWSQDNVQHCGFYTQAEIIDIVAYAEARHIEVIPEINLPGHMSAAIASIPSIGVEDAPGFSAGLKVQTNWGSHPYLLNTKDSTFQWLDALFTNIISLFPNSRYIHIGGDDIDKGQWKASAETQAKITTLNITGDTSGNYKEHDLHAWYIKKVADIIESKGKKVIGWESILDDVYTSGLNVALSTDTVIIAQHSSDALDAAARKGHPAILSYGASYDYYQEPESTALAKGTTYESISGFISLEDAYKFNPISATLAPKYHQYVMGGQALLWSQYAHTLDKTEYLIFPRAAAFSEAVWSPVDDKNYADFIARLPITFNHYNARNINYGPTVSYNSVEFSDHTIAQSTMTANRSHGLWATQDHDISTYFSSSASPLTNDTITLDLHTTLTKGYVKIKTGIPSAEGIHTDFLVNGVIETSSDNMTWQSIATFDNGNALGKFTGSINHIRLKSNQDQNTSWLKVPEIVYGKAFTIEENTANGTMLTDASSLFTVPSTLTTPTYKFDWDNDTNPFSIDESSGKITVTNSTALDYETLETAITEATVTLSGGNTDLQKRTLFIEVTDMIETWTDIINANQTVDKLVYYTNTAILSESEITIDLSGITGNSATYEFFVNAKNKGQPAANLLRTSNVAYRYEQWNNTNKYGVSRIGIKNDVFTPEPGKSVNTIYGALTHVVFVIHSGSLTSLYINAELIGTVNGVGPLITTATAILSDRNALGNTGDNVMLAAAMYNSALTAEAIMIRYQAYMP